MKRLLVNGSPRGAHANSSIIITWIMEGLREAGAETPAVTNLARTRDMAANRDAFLEADEVILVFPLYTDSTPGIVKTLIDALADVDRKGLRGKRFGFVVHSGFPESVHSEPVADYLERLCRRLGMTFIGRAIKGGSEGIQIMPERMTRKTRKAFIAIGRSLELDGCFDTDAVGRLSQPRRLSKGFLLLWRFLSMLSPPNLYWKYLLKKHGAWEKRFDQPYAAFVKAGS